MPDASSTGRSAAAETESVATPLLALRAAVGGVLMGLANLVPGISGGTMLLASGVYPRFIQAIAEVTTLKFRRASLLVLGVVVVAAGLSILLLAGAVKGLVVDHRWVMYSLFIGLTLGGVPVVWGMAKPPTRSLWIGAAVGFAVMALLAWVQSAGAGGAAGRDGLVMMFVAGVAGASAMILPGISGGYLLLVLGVYVPILGAIDAVKQALKAGDPALATEPILYVVVPVGVGVVVGVVAVSNLLRLLLDRFEKPTLGALLGFLVGAVVGLWPFQQGVKPEVGAVIRGRTMTPELLEQLSPDKYPTELFDPAGWQIAVALGLVAAGFALTAVIARLGGDKKATA